MKGMDTRPTSVEIQGFFRIVLALLLCANWTAAQILFIVKPGTITDANVCHMRVSSVDNRTFLVFFGVVSTYVSIIDCQLSLWRDRREFMFQICSHIPDRLLHPCVPCRQERIRSTVHNSTTRQISAPGFWTPRRLRSHNLQRQDRSRRFMWMSNVNDDALFNRAGISN